ncbi:MAG TPA: Crp/Fnr family transcriptional regulator [Terriglobia bacterium]|nr:Crp/Fnr family transcriptional regulator [Terriglobia bacterium]
MARKRSRPLTPQAFLGKLESLVQDFRHRQAIYSQGDPADAVFYVQKGKIKQTVVSKQGKEAVLAIAETGHFFGEGSLVVGHSVRMSSASSIGRSTVLRFNKDAVVRLLHEDVDFADLFVSYALARTVRVEEDLVDQLFNSTERRLARSLLLLSHFGKDGKPQSVVPKISQETLAQMVGASRARVSSFMNKFRKLGLIDYNGGNGGLQVNSSLLSIVLRD